MRKETVPVRITTSQYQKLNALVEATGQGIGHWLQRAVDNFIADEAPIWFQAADTAKKKRGRKSM
jgi:predicted DNA-binding protein